MAKSIKGTRTEKNLLTSFAGESQASEYVFTRKDKGSEIAKKISSDKEALNMGIGFEKDSVIFYGGMKRIVPGTEHRLIDELIGQEQEHITKLYELKKTL